MISPISFGQHSQEPIFALGCVHMCVFMYVFYMSLAYQTGGSRLQGNCLEAWVTFSALYLTLDDLLELFQLSLKEKIVSEAYSGLSELPLPAGRASCNPGEILWKSSLGLQ